MIYVKYTTADGEIVCAGQMPNLVAGPGEAVIQVEGDTPDVRRFRVQNGAIVSKSVAELAALDDADTPVTAQQVRNFVNAGSTQADKFDRLLLVTSRIAAAVCKKKDLT